MNVDTNFNMLIDGELCGADAMFDVVNPANEQVIASVPNARPADLDRAVAAARGAFPAWSALSIDDRKEKLKALGNAIWANADSLSALLTKEQGKPLHEAKMEVMGAGYWLQAYTGLDLPVTVNEDSAERYSETRHLPIGVVGAIAPWNFPLLLAMFKIPPALLAGNTVVLKPSPYTPLTTLKMGELARDILPAGVLNIITGGDDLGPWMTAHPGIDKISFTGSTQTGRRVMASAAPTLKRLTLELGGNDPAIVLPDVDVAAIAPRLFWAAFGNNGQVCIAAKRIYIHKDVYEPLKRAIADYAGTVKVGDGAAEGTQLGPINNQAQFRRILALIQDAKDTGCHVLTGGSAHEGAGYFVPPTIIDNPPESSRVVQEEQFGPIMPLLQYEDYDDLIRRVNASDFGLAASVWGQDLAQAQRIADRIASGTVWINEIQHLSPLAAFGGMKQSGLGVEGGVDGLLEYTYAKTTTRAKPASAAV
jgi:acyl-CoA reductase-like NAD-dependent aldehyde dehydrogenase